MNPGIWLWDFICVQHFLVLTDQICGQYLLSASVYKTALIELYLFRETHKNVLHMLFFFAF